MYKISFMKKSISEFITKFKELSRGKQIVIIFVFILIVGSLTSNSNSSKSSSNDYNYNQGSSSSQSLKCDECGSSFQKSNGVQLSGHSEVFCSQACATRWGFAHGISVN